MPDNLEIVARYIAQSRPSVNASVADTGVLIEAWNALAAEVKELRSRPVPDPVKA